MKQYEALLKAMEASDMARVSQLLAKISGTGKEAWETHLSIYPVVQRVLNPPFINPHLPKMYHICRELAPYLTQEELPALVRLEIQEYARRPKFEELPKVDKLKARVSFSEIHSAVKEQDREKTAVLLASFHHQAGGPELARRLLLLGSGYLDDSLGHSISCTVFILLEMLERVDEDPWPALATLADYFCKGRFHAMPSLKNPIEPPSDEALDELILRSTSGRGIVNLHHTITFYAVERARHLLNEQEVNHMLQAWIAFMGNKEVDIKEPGVGQDRPAPGSREFSDLFSRLDTGSVVASSMAMAGSRDNRRQLGRLLIKGLCDLYQGDYNPHYLTGLGSALFIINRCWQKPTIAANALYQYIDFLFSGIK